MNLLRLMVASCAVAMALPSVGDGRVESAELTLEVNATNASFRVTDRRTGRTWESEPQYPHMPQNLAVTGCEVVDREIRLTMTASGGRNLSATFRLEPEPGEMTVTFDTGWRYKKEWEMAFPGPLRSKRGDRLIVPLNEGMGYPVEGESEGLRNRAGFSGHGLSMGFFGVAADAGGAGWMAIVEESPDDMRMEVFRLGEEQLLSAGARWISENRVIGYPRRLRFVFFAAGGHVAMCKRYRRYAKEKGYLKTFREKAKIRPDVLKLPGSVNIWYFRKDQAAMAKELHDAGIERMLWSGGKHTDASNVTEIAKIPGVLVGRYDLYQGVYPPELAAKCGGGQVGYNPEAWPDDILWSGPTSNDWRRGWEVKAKDGTKHPLAMLCPAKAPDYARRKIPPDLAARPYNARFLDTTCSSQWFECLNPAHPLTRRQCHLKRLELLGVLSDELKLVTGTENGHESAVPVCDYFEGMMSISPYTLPDCGRNMDVIWTNALPALTAKYSMNEKLRLPLWELVFHDCVCNEYYWGDYNNKMPQLWYRKDVFNLLYGTMPMFMFNRDLWKARKGTFLRSYRMCEPVARATGFSEMVDHRFLVQDRSVQETEFSDGTVVTVNFTSKPFRCGDGYEIPRYEYRVRLPPRPEGCYMRDAQKEVDFSPAATYPGFKLDTRVESRGNMCLHNVRLEHLGTGDRAMTFTYDIPLPEGPITAFTGPDQQRTLKYWEAPAEMETRACEAGSGRLPRWPFLAVKAADGTHALGLAPGSVAIYRLSVDPARRILRVAFDLGFASEHRDASFAFATFSFDAEAEAGYRGAWKVWMEAFPDSYTVRDRTHGTWMVHLPIGEVKGWEDFGFRYKEGYKDAVWDRAHGVLPLRYTSSGAWSMRYIDKKVKDVTKATYEDAFAEAQSQVARKVPKALSWKDCRMLDANGKPAGVCLNQGWGQGWTWSVNSAPGIQGESTDFSQKASKDVLSQWHDEGHAKFPLGGEYYDSSSMYMTVQLDYDRGHFAAMRTPLTYAKDTFRPVIHKGMMGFEYLKSIADGMHARGKIVMANGAPSVWCWVPQLCDVLGSEANWLRGGKWKPPRRDELILVRMQCGGKPYCVIQNTDFAAFGPYVERYMQLCLAYGFLPGFFSPKSAADDSHYFRHPEFYERDRALFRKYLPLCRLLSESGWRPVNTLAPQAARGDVSAEQFGDRYVALYNHSQTAAAEVEVPAARERVTGADVRGRISIPPMECRVLEISPTATAEVKPLVVEGAPFALTVAEWTPPAREFRITDYGAKPEATPYRMEDAVTEAVEAAIEAAAKAGGGRVVVPAGRWLCGAFKLKSDVALVLEKGAVLHFPDDPVIVMRAPLKPDGRPTMTHRALVGATGCTNVAVMGEGTLKSDVAYWHDNFMKNPQRGWGRPQVIHFEQCKNVRLEGFKVRGSPAWTMHLKVCEDIVMRGVDSICTGPNTDGLDLESCNRALVENCSLDQTDDTYTIKSGFNEAGRKRNIPTQNVVIRNCRAVHGHTLLGVGSEVSGGIRNIYMTDCTVEAECWRFLFVKTNAKRGAFVKNVWLENIRGLCAGQAVFETEMYYDGNPNKELTKKGGPTWPTRIHNIHVKNVTCAEAGFAVKVRGDPELPPKGLHVENIRIGKLRYEPVKAVNAPELDVKDVREDPSVVREILGVPPWVKQFDPDAKMRPHGTDGGVEFRREVLETLSLNEIARRVIEGRIAAEVAKGRNVAPRVTPVEVPKDVETYSSTVSRRITEILQDYGCALPGAWIADDVRQVSRAEKSGRVADHPGLAFSLRPDPDAGKVTLSLVNGVRLPLENIWCVVHLPPAFMTRRQTFRAARIEAGGRFEKTIPVGAGSHYLPRAVGNAPYAAEVDFMCDSRRSRIWATAETPTTQWHPDLNEKALHAGPLDTMTCEDAKLARISAETGALPALGESERAAWRSPAFPGAAWYNVSPAPRPYIETEKRLVRVGRACEVVALQFDAPTNTVTNLRCSLWRGALAFLNGARIPLTGGTQKILARVGVNRLLVKYPCKPGDRTGMMQLSLYPWVESTCWPCVAFEEKSGSGEK